MNPIESAVIGPRSKSQGPATQRVIFKLNNILIFMWLSGEHQVKGEQENCWLLIACKSQLRPANLMIQ